MRCPNHRYEHLLEGLRNITRHTILRIESNKISYYHIFAFSLQAGSKKPQNADECHTQGSSPADCVNWKAISAATPLLNEVTTDPNLDLKMYIGLNELCAIRLGPCWVRRSFKEHCGIFCASETLCEKEITRQSSFDGGEIKFNKVLN